MQKYKKKAKIRKRGGRGRSVLLASLLFGGLCSGCTTTIHSYGEHATFELSPARNVLQNGQFDVMNGLSTGLPSSWFSSSAGGGSSPAGKNSDVLTANEGSSVD